MCSKECVEKIENLFRECFQSVLLAAAITAQLKPDQSVLDSVASSSSNVTRQPSDIFASLSQQVSPSTPDAIQASLQNFVSRFLPTTKAPRRKRHRKPKSSRLQRTKEPLEFETTAKDSTQVVRYSKVVRSSSILHSFTSLYSVYA